MRLIPSRRTGAGMAIAVAAAGLAAPSLAAPAWAQTMREYTAARQRHGETFLAVRLDFAAGTLRLEPADAATLYRMRLRYDQERFTPVSAFRARDGHVTLGTRSVGGGGLRVSSRDQLKQSAVVALAPSTDLALDANLGAVEADVELGGLRLRDVRLTAGASRTIIRFSRPNAVPCDTAAFEGGATELAIYGLGNSRCGSIRFEGGVGKVTLDFTGRWTANATADLRMAMGELVLRLPKRVGVRVSMEKFLASFDNTGWTRRGASYVSPGYDRAPRHLDITLAATIGNVTVEWVD